MKKYRIAVYTVLGSTFYLMAFNFALSTFTQDSSKALSSSDFDTMEILADEVCNSCDFVGRESIDTIVLEEVEA